MLVATHSALRVTREAFRTPGGSLFSELHYLYVRREKLFLSMDVDEEGLESNLQGRTHSESTCKENATSAAQEE